MLINCTLQSDCCRASHGGALRLLMSMTFCLCCVTLSVFGVCRWLWCVRKREDNVWNSSVVFYHILYNVSVVKGLKAAVAVLKEEIVVSDKVWKKEAIQEQRVWRAAGVSHFSQCRGGHTHTGEDSILGGRFMTLEMIKSIQGAFHTTQRIQFVFSISESASAWTIPR